ncbi:MAG: ABC transporter permease [Magnetococcales bacterium]|nr:ABC transporter permease [Magnetococcales bacterium]
MPRFLPRPTLGFIQIVRRHFLVWRKTSAASLVGNLGEPLLYLTGMGYGLGRFVGDIGSLPYLVFVAAGILSASSMNTATFEALYGGFTRMTRQNTYHAMLATPLGVADVVLGEVVWAAVKSLFAGLAIFLVGTLLGAFPGPQAWLALPVVFLAGLVFGGIGMVVTAISPGYDFFLYYFTLVSTPMFLFCGVFYPVASLPEGVQTLVAALPLTHVVALIRPLGSGTPPEDVMVHLGALLLFALTAYPIAVLLIKRRIIV